MGSIRSNLATLLVLILTIHVYNAINGCPDFLQHVLFTAGNYVFLAVDLPDFEPLKGVAEMMKSELQTQTGFGNRITGLSAEQWVRLLDDTRKMTLKENEKLRALFDYRAKVVPGEVLSGESAVSLLRLDWKYESLVTHVKYLRKHFDKFKVDLSPLPEGWNERSVVVNVLITQETFFGLNYDNDVSRDVQLRYYKLWLRDTVDNYVFVIPRLIYRTLLLTFILPMEKSLVYRQFWNYLFAGILGANKPVYVNSEYVKVLNETIEGEFNVLDALENYFAMQKFTKK